MNRDKIRASWTSFFKLDIIQEFIFSGLGCLFFVFLFSTFPKQYWNTVYRTTMILVLTLIFFIIFLIVNQISPKKRIFKIDYKRNIILYTIYFFATILFLFYDTYWGYNGLSGDNFYKTAYITRMASSGYPQDFIYKDLSAFYSPLYWYCLALLARLLQINPYKMMRIGLLIICYIMPIIIFESWKKIYSVKISFVITVLSIPFLFNIYGPDHTIGWLTIIPFFIYFYENYPGKEFKKKDFIIAGILGSLVFCTFFYYFLMIPIYYFIKLIQNKNEFKTNLKHIVYISISISIFSCWFWIPLVRDILLIGFESHQNRYFAPQMLKIPFNEYFRFSIIGAFYAAGIVYIIRKYSVSRDLRILGNLLLSIHILFLIGFIGILTNFPIMHIRFLEISSYILLISSSIFYVNLFHFLSKNNSFKINTFLSETYVLIIIIFTISNGIFLSYNETPAYHQAREQDVNYKLIDKYEELDYEDKVFLSSDWVIAAYLPVYLFLLPNPYFSHPSALYNQRVQFLIELSECETSKKFYDKLMGSKFGPIDYFYLDLEDNQTKLVFGIAIEEFPDGRVYYEIKFDRVLFLDNKYFEEIDVKGDIVYRTKY